MAKLHTLRPGVYGLFENEMTFCGMAGSIITLDGKNVLWHHMTGARYEIEDKELQSCKVCAREAYEASRKRPDSLDAVENAGYSHG